MILDVFRCSQQFSNVFRLFSNCFPTMFSDCWNPLQTELNYLWYVGPQLFLGWYQIISDVFRCSQLFSCVFWPILYTPYPPMPTRMLAALLHWNIWIRRMSEDKFKCFEVLRVLMIMLFVWLDKFQKLSIEFTEYQTRLDSIQIHFFFILGSNKDGSTFTLYHSYYFSWLSTSVSCLGAIFFLQINGSQSWWNSQRQDEL